MKLPKKRLYLVSIRTGTSKSGNPYAFVKLADKETFENVDAMVGRETDFKILEIRQDYDAVFDIDGDYVSVDLSPVRTATTGK